MYDLKFDWRGFELHPETPAGGMDLRNVFPGGQAAEFMEYLVDFARRFGLDDLHLSDHVPSTRRALAVTEFARQEGRLHAFKEAAMAAHFRHGEDIEDLEVLARLGAEVGLDADAAARAAGDPEYLGRVDDLRAEAAAAGVTGIPTLMFGEGGPVVVGCQPVPELARAAEQAGAEKRPTS